MSEGQRFERFHPLTVRTATRLARMARLGRVSDRELQFYMRELTRLDGPHQPAADEALLRLAWRRAEHGRCGVPSRLQMVRRSVSVLPAPSTLTIR